AHYAVGKQDSQKTLSSLSKRNKKKRNINTKSAGNLGPGLGPVKIQLFLQQAE
ncbi:hypothetical protein P7K49_002656, partial [Saguinus oedipus]